MCWCRRKKGLIHFLPELFYPGSSCIQAATAYRDTRGSFFSQASLKKYGSHGRPVVTSGYQRTEKFRILIWTEGTGGGENSVRLLRARDNGASRDGWIPRWITTIITFHVPCFFFRDAHFRYRYWKIIADEKNLRVPFPFVFEPFSNDSSDENTNFYSFLSRTHRSMYEGGKILRYIMFPCFFSFLFFFFCQRMRTADVKGLFCASNGERSKLRPFRGRSRPACARKDSSFCDA